MRFWIDGVQQEVLVRLKLKAHDAVILRYIRDLLSHPDKIHTKMFKVKSGEEKPFYHISKTLLLENLPILNWKKDTLKRRLKLYVKKGILYKKEMKLYSPEEERTTGLTYKRIFFYRIGKNAEELLFHTPGHKSKTT